MSVDEMKKVVHQQVDSLTESQLEQVNLFIESINHSVNNSTFLQNAMQIIEERKDVLSKLAQ